MKKKVVVGMSGGVDSSVAAYLLKEQGYDVIGVTMQVWQEKDRKAEGEDACGLLASDQNEGEDIDAALKDAGKAAAFLDIPHYVIDFKKEFHEKVVDYFVGEYLAGRTPNPCVVCNRYVKWEALLKRSMELGADYIATGHYARIGRLSNGRYAVCSGVSAQKDQTYALYDLTQFQLAHTLMPVGDYRKEEIRRIARENRLPVADKPDSQDICFVADGDYAGFIKRLAPDRVPGEGNFLSEDGTVLGVHKGIIHYTVGQRKGLGLSLGHPVFVSKIIPETNEIIISQRDVFCRELICDRINFMGMEDLKTPRRLTAKVRYAHKGQWCMAEQIGEDRIKCVFEEPVRAVTPGQAVVFYDGEYVMGGGTIL